jgi:ADP-heptose:LPS heptosyltransferase
VKQRNPTATVILECYPSLMKLFARCPGIDVLVPHGQELPRFDLQTPLLSVPGLLKTALDTIPAQTPYLYADPPLIQYWRNRLKQVQGPRIGINWRGQVATRQRDIPLQCLKLLAERSAASFISLQKDATHDELSAISGDEKTVIDLGPALDATHGAFMDTAAVMMNLDLVITSDTAIVHLAGALAVPVWMLLPFVPDWRWLLDREDSPWYPTMRLFRQKSPGDWDGVFHDVAAALQQTTQNITR